jgi:hypothetical protein
MRSLASNLVERAVAADRDLPPTRSCAHRE